MRFEDLTLRDLLDAVAAKTPTPGGGAVASITAALAAALAQMVVNFSIGKKSLADHKAAHTKALEHLREMASRAMELAQRDAAAYARLNELWKLDREDRRRRAEFDTAVAAAIEAPQAVVHLAIDMLHVIQSLTGNTNAQLKSDLAVAAILAEAAARAGAWNVRINLPLVEDSKRKQALNHETAETIKTVRSLCNAIEESCA